MSQLSSNDRFVPHTGGHVSTFNYDVLRDDLSVPAPVADSTTITALESYDGFEARGHEFDPQVAVYLISQHLKIAHRKSGPSPDPQLGLSLKYATSLAVKYVSDCFPNWFNLETDAAAGVLDLDTLIDDTIEDLAAWSEADTSVNFAPRAHRDLAVSVLAHTLSEIESLEAADQIQKQSDTYQQLADVVDSAPDSLSDDQIIAFVETLCQQR